MSQVLASLEDEQAVLGAVLLSETVLGRVVVDVGLRPEHFYNAKLGAIYGAMLALADRGEPVDVRTVCAELSRQRDRMPDGVEVDATEVDALAAAPPSIGNIMAYARRVRELATLRQKQQAAHLILSAVAR